MYVNCPHCQLSIKVRHPWIAPEHCPRCIGRSRLASPMFQSPLPYRLLAEDPSALPAGGADRAAAFAPRR